MAYLAEQLRVDADGFADYAWSGRTIEYHRAQVRAAFGFREFAHLTCAMSDPRPGGSTGTGDPVACTNSDAREEPDGLWLGEVVLVGVADGLGAVGGADFGVDVVDV
ncbi:MAG TPA: DUF4158 domain-containing protein, partial [Amycolatopsis sp.]|nr:DUF4158 domain-containing protein [Amycolatopsis sp.]